MPLFSNSLTVNLLYFLLKVQIFIIEKYGCISKYDALEVSSGTFLLKEQKWHVCLKKLWLCASIFYTL